MGVEINNEPFSKEILGAQGSPQIFLAEGGGIADIYVNRELLRDMNGNIFVDPQTGSVKMVDVERKKVGSLLPKYNMGWSNSFGYKNFNLNVLISARIGGNVVSNTEAYLDFHGISERSAEARDNGGVEVNGHMIDAKSFYQTIGANTGEGAYYVYSATNVRLQELSLSYDLPSKWFRNRVNMSVSLVGRNLFMIYNQAPFDPELAPSSTSTFYSGVDNFMHPSLRNYGFSVKLQF